MKKGGALHDKKIVRMTQNVGLFVPLALCIYALFLLLNIVDRSPLFSTDLLLLVTGALIPLSLYQYLVTPRSATDIIVRLFAFHVIAFTYIIFAAGFSPPFLMAWAILIMFSHIYFSKRGFTISLSALIVTLIFAATIFGASLNEFLNAAMTSTIAVAVALVAIYINGRKEEEAQQAEKSHLKEQIERDNTLTLINNLTDAIAGVNHNGAIETYNAAFLNLIDINALPADRSIDKVLTVTDENDKPISVKKLLKAATSVTINDSLRLIVDNEPLRLELTYSPIRGVSTKDNDKPGYMLILRDVTKSKSLEEERDEFISVVSHELRTPIAITEGAIDNAQLIFTKDSTKTEMVKSSLSMAHEQIVFLSKMVNDLSTLSRAERGVADEAELIDVTELAHTLHSEYSPEAATKKLRLNLQTKGDLGHVKASRLYLQELLQNFITNAIKYTKEGSIDLIIERNDDTLHFAVKDTGIGISRTDLKKIFEKFYRSEDYRTRETGGTGLGLYVAQKLSKKLGCHIDVKSRLNHGSTFSFELPASKDET